VVVNEGFSIGEDAGARDGFGHLEYGAGETTAMQNVVSALGRRGLPVRGHATGQVPGVLQRDASACRSEVDEREAYEVGRHAVRVAIEEGTGWMSTILRAETAPAYRAYYSKVALDVIANTARQLPPAWIVPSGIDVTDDYIRYAMPLIGEGARGIPATGPGGLPAYANLDRTPMPKICKAYTPVNYRL
jgi:6-phosphofructokinase 1